MQKKGFFKKFEYFALRFLISLISILNLTGVRKTARLLADFNYYGPGIRKGITLDNLRKSFPDMPEKWIRETARRSFHNTLIVLFEFFYFPRFTDKLIEKNISFENLKVLTDANDEKKGLILMSGHFGNWEFLAMALMKLLKLNAKIVVKNQRNLYVDNYINSLRTLHTNDVVSMKSAGLQVTRVLQKKGIVAMLADQSATRKSVYVTFFGREAATFGGPARFAVQSGAPVVMAFAVRQEDDSYKIRFERIFTDDLTGTTEENVLKLTQRHTSLLEKQIREYPDHWLWQHRRWKHLINRRDK